MRIPEGVLQNTAAAFAIIAFFLSLAGIAACAALYAASYVAISSVDATVTPQFDSAEAALYGASAALSSAASAASYANGTISSVSSALQSYSDSTSELAGSLSGIASVPPFSLDPKIAAAAIQLSQASQQFANASQSASQMSGSAAGAFASIQGVASGIDRAASNLADAKRSFRSSISSLSWLSLIFCLCLAALFSSVAFCSLSVLLSHYPNMLQREEKGSDGAKGKA